MQTKSFKNVDDARAKLLEEFKGQPHGKLIAETLADQLLRPGAKIEEEGVLYQVLYPEGPSTPNSELAVSWDEQLGFGFKRHLLSLASDDDHVMIHIKHVPEKGMWAYVSPPGWVNEDGNGIDMLVFSGNRGTQEQLENAKKLAVKCYEEWRLGHINSPEDAASWFHKQEITGFELENSIPVL